MLANDLVSALVASGGLNLFNGHFGGGSKLFVVAHYLISFDCHPLTYLA